MTQSLCIYLVVHKHIASFHCPLYKLISSHCLYHHDIDNIQLGNDEISDHFQCNEPKVHSKTKNNTIHAFDRYMYNYDFWRNSNTVATIHIWYIGSYSIYKIDCISIYLKDYVISHTCFDGLILITYTCIWASHTLRTLQSIAWLTWLE